MNKKCAHCHKEKDVSQFHHNKHRKDGLNVSCKTCLIIMTRESAIRRKVFFAEHPIAEKKCCYCHQVKPTSEFYKNVSETCGYTIYCKPCVLIISKKRSHLTTWWYRRCFGGGRAILTNAVSPVELEQLYDAHPFCTYCNVSLQGENIYNVHVDHKIPKKRGGTDKIENLCIACKECNRMKHTMTDTEFRAFLLAYISRFDAPIQATVHSLSTYANKEPQL